MVVVSGEIKGRAMEGKRNEDMIWMYSVEGRWLMAVEYHKMPEATWQSL